MSDVGPVTAIWPPSPIARPVVEEAVDPDAPTALLEQTLDARMTASDWFAIIIVGMIALLIWATAAFMLATTLLRWSQGATFGQCVAEAQSVQAQSASCLNYPGR